jgi:hypothetical protein
MPSSSREWISERKVWLSTTGRPPSTRCGMRSAAPRAHGGGVAGAKGTSGFRHSTRSSPMSSSTRACSVFFSAPSTYQRPSICTGGNSPGSAALAATACEMGTWSQPGRPKGAACRCPGRWPPAPAALQAAEVVAAPGRRQHAAQVRFQRRVLNSPVGSARPRRSSAPSTERRSNAKPAPPAPARPAAWPGGARIRPGPGG